MKNSLPHILAILSVLLAARFSAAAQTYTAEPLPFAQALPSKEITSLHQDREGMIWVGTTFGVARYDGQETTVFKSDYSTPDRLTHNYVSPMADSRNYVFIGTQNGLNVFDKATWQLSPVREGPFAGVEIRHLHVDKKEQVWIAVGRSLFAKGFLCGLHSILSAADELRAFGEDPRQQEVEGVHMKLSAFLFHKGPELFDDGREIHMSGSEWNLTEFSRNSFSAASTNSFLRSSLSFVSLIASS